MDTEFTPLHERFGALAEQLTAPGPIDIDKALAQGRRQRGHRRTRSAAFAATGVTAAAALTLAAVNLHTPAGPAHAVLSPSSTFARTSTDPVAVGVSFGWLPAGMQAEGTTTEAGPNGTAVWQLVAETGTADSGLLQLGDAPAGPRPSPSMDVTPPTPLVTVAGPAVNGHGSYIESLPGDPPGPGSDAPFYLVWQFDDGRWATLYVQSPPKGTISEDDAVRVARGVTEKPYPIPEYFQIAGPLAAADVVAVTVGMQNGPQLTMRAAGAEIEIALGSGKSNSTQQCKSSHESPETVCVSVHGQLPPSLAPAGIQGILGDITLLGFPTTDVIR